MTHIAFQKKTKSHSVAHYLIPAISPTSSLTTVPPTQYPAILNPKTPLLCPNTPSTRDWSRQSLNNAYSFSALSSHLSPPGSPPWVALLHLPQHIQLYIEREKHLPHDIFIHSIKFYWAPSMCQAAEVNKIKHLPSWSLHSNEGNRQ